MKFKGFSAVIEYADSSASGIDEIYVDQYSSTVLTPSQISSFLVLGSSFNIDLGYFMKKGYSFDFRFGVNKPEFEKKYQILLFFSIIYLFNIFSIILIDNTIW